MTVGVLPLHLVPDLPRHGVARNAYEIAETCGCAVTAGEPEPGQPLHLHFTERLWGSDPETAAARVSELGRRHPMSVTLHDLPQASDGPDSQSRRVAAYARVVAAARAVACNSRWEAELLAAFAAPLRPPKIIPLAVRSIWTPPPHVSPPPPVSAPHRPVIGLLGYVYPGKGHSEAIDAAAACAQSLEHSVDVVALGAVSKGHETDAGALGERARRQRVSFSVTGYLSDDQLMRCAREVTVPLAAHQHVSASGSIGSWLTAGRRPLVIDSRYAREIDALRPETIHRYDSQDLVRAVMWTLDDPRRTWLSPQTDLRPGPEETAASYLQWWREEVPW